jgi:hypothetical protein
MKYFYCLIISIAFVVTGCSYIKDYDKPHLELTGQNPYSLSISKFIWGYGTTEINKFNGDFEKLDEKVYEKLKGKQGTCKIFMEAITKDKYGKEVSKSDYIGDIELSELNKFQNWEYWHKESGIKSLLYKKYILVGDSEQVDSARMGSAKMDTISTDRTPNITIQPLQHLQKKRTYALQYSDLYPNPDNQNLSDERRHVDGYITDVNFTNEVMVIKEDSGESLIVQFYPMEASSYTYNQLRLALKAGNRFEGTVARAGASTVDLASAYITEK